MKRILIRLIIIYFSLKDSVELWLAKRQADAMQLASNGRMFMVFKDVRGYSVVSGKAIRRVYRKSGRYKKFSVERRLDQALYITKTKRVKTT
jgi:hypothetical protein